MAPPPLESRIVGRRQINRTRHGERQIEGGRYPTGDRPVLGLELVDLREPVQDVRPERPEHAGQQEIGERASADHVPAPVLVRRGDPRAPPRRPFCAITDTLQRPRASRFESFELTIYHTTYTQPRVDETNTVTII